MKIKCIAIGKTLGSYGLEEVQTYVKRIQHFMPFEFIELKEIKHNKHNRENALLNEEKSILMHVSSRDALILFDEKGKQMDSIASVSYTHLTLPTNLSV